MNPQQIYPNLNEYPGYGNQNNNPYQNYQANGQPNSQRNSPNNLAMNNANLIGNQFRANNNVMSHGA
jgi:hypothetical protein